MLDDGEYISPDAKIEIPEDGMKLVHADGETEWLPPDSVEIVTDKNGFFLYVSLRLEHAKILEEMIKAGSGSEMDRSVTANDVSGE